MAERTGATDVMPPLGLALWLFVVWKVGGILCNVAVLVLLVAWILPTQASLSDGLVDPDSVANGLYLLLESAGGVVGILLLARRHRKMRLFWILFLSATSLFLLGDFVWLAGEEILLPFIVTGVGWLIYWVVAKRPRELQLAGFWTTP